jgi:hypothetical protein
VNDGSFPEGTTYTNIRTGSATQFAATSSASVICPDLLRYEQLGEADGLRGKLVRAFFWLLGPR